MKGNKELAVKKFKQGYNCCQAVACAYCEELGIKEEDEIRVCELFDQYTRKGIAQGISQGISQGVAQGIIIMCKDFNTSYEETLQKVRLKLNISEQEAEKEMKLYW